MRHCYIILFIACIFSSLTTSATEVKRLNNSEPVITKQMFTELGIGSDGENINGPSVIRIPDWVAEEDKAHPSAVYYMYFGHHGGNYIRMAWSENLEGPWTIFNAGSNNDPRVNGRGVLDLGSSDDIEFNVGVRIYDHIASPDIVIDHVNKQFLLYFHGPTKSTTEGNKYFDTWYQMSFVATSKSGLNFNCPDNTSVSGGVGGGEEGHGVKNATLGNAYFRTFHYNNELYAFSNYGPIWKSPSTSEPWQTSSPKATSWTEGPLEGNPIFADLAQMYNSGGARHEAGNAAPRTGAPRHFATHLRADGKTLEVWYTCRGDMPERIFSTTIDLSKGEWTEWDSVITDQTQVHTEMLRPELDWEGANKPLAISGNGSENGVNQLRDPALFQDTDGRRYLFYSGAGESAIGIAEIIEENTEPLPAKIKVVAISDSNHQDGRDGHFVNDGDLDTRWSSNVDGAELTLELDDFYAVSSIKIAQFNGDRRKAFFDLEYSLDGEEWNSIGSFETSGTTLELEKMSFDFVYARYIRFIGHGNSASAWNSYNEVEIYGIPAEIPEDQKLIVVSAGATNEQSGNPAGNVLDGSLETRWSSNVNGVQLTLELESPATVTEVKIAAFLGDRRKTYFDLETSLDGTDWTSHGSFESSGTSLQLQTYNIADSPARFVRLTGHGNSSSAWNSYTELEIHGRK